MNEQSLTPSKIYPLEDEGMSEEDERTSTVDYKEGKKKWKGWGWQRKWGNWLGTTTKICNILYKLSETTLLLVLERTKLTLKQ